MKIIHVITALNRGGAETQLLRVVKEFKDRGITQIVISLRQGETEIRKELLSYGISVI